VTTHLDAIPTPDLLAALEWADQRARTANTGGFAPRLLADRLRAPLGEVTPWLYMLSVAGMLVRRRTDGGGHVYLLQFRAAPVGRAAA